MLFNTKISQIKALVIRRTKLIHRLIEDKQFNNSCSMIEKSTIEKSNQFFKIVGSTLVPTWSAARVVRASK